MRLSRLPLIASIALFAAGGALMLSARSPNQFSLVPIHQITDSMETAADREAAVPAPPLVRTSTEGEKIDLHKLTEKGPVYLVFIKDECPCSILAQPFFQRLYDAFGGKVTFVGITDAKLPAAKEWKAHFQMTFPLISDPKVDVMKEFQATNSAFSELIGKDGRIVRQWPGYDREMLLDIESMIAKEAGVDEPQMKLDDAPTEPTVGCTYS